MNAWFNIIVNNNTTGKENNKGVRFIEKFIKNACFIFPKLTDIKNHATDYETFQCFSTIKISKHISSLAY